MMGEGVESEEGDGEGGSVRADVQKKITRWASGPGVLEELFPGQRLMEGEGEMKSGGLILVASLLTKVPNLGGENDL